MAAKTFGTGGANIDSLVEMGALSWADLKDTLEAWDKEWIQGANAFLKLDSTPTAAEAKKARTKLFLFLYGIWLTQNQGGNDRSQELLIHPQSRRFVYEFDIMLKREPQVPLNPAQSS